MDWISVKDRMPECEGKYLVCAASLDKDIPFYAIAWLNIDLGRWELIPKVWADGIEYWMELPEYPEKG